MEKPLDLPKLLRTICDLLAEPAETRQARAVAGVTPTRLDRGPAEALRPDDATTTPAGQAHYATFLGPLHGPRRRKNCGLFVAEMVTHLLVPLSVTLAAFVSQLAGGASVPACSNPKPAVSVDGQETITLVPEGSTESAGRERVGRWARAMYPDTFAPAVVK